ncbi:MAG: YncE family protein [Rudaea sp.]|uniref:YVTN family beta-propeller repeat protein n=1 Tax=Rudaea sp. TaxID=2136325 RepID=UPI0039E410D6
MSKASGAGKLKMSLESSGAGGLRGKSRGVKCAAIALVLALAAPLVSAAPFAYVANYSGCTIDSTTYSGCVTVLDLALASDQVVATIPATTATSTTAATGVEPLGVAINPAGTRVYVANYGDSTDLTTSGTVSVIDSDQTSATLNTVIATITVGIRPELLVVNPNGSTVYVANSVGKTVSVIDTATNTETTKISVGGMPVGVAFTPDGTKAYVTLANNSKVAVIDATTNTVSKAIALSSQNPIGIAVNPAGTFAYVANYAQGDYSQTGTVSVIDTATDAEVAAIPVDIGPTGVAVSPDGGSVYVTNYVSDTLSVIDTATNTVTAEITVGLGPLGVSVDSNGTYAYVNNASDDTVAVVDLATHVLRGTIASGGSAPNYSAITSSAGLAVNLDQAGLTGAWYNASVSGQGIVLESSPDANGTGQGRFFAGWFTYDVTATGGQRWYSLQGDVSSTDQAAALTIYEGTGGNFAVGPAVSAVAVGQATLQFTDCSHAVLRYTFSDGSGRAGFIALDRLTGGATCTTSGDSGAVSGGDQYSGSWYNPDTSGQGLVLNVDSTKSPGPILFGGWFTYAQDGQQIGGGASQNWFTLQTTAAPSAVTSYSANILTGSGGAFLDPASTVTTTTVGSASVLFTSCTTATLTYSFAAGTNTGLSGTLDLVRLGSPPAGCE